MNAAGLSTGLAAYRDESPATPIETLFQRCWARWALFIAFWTFLGLFNAGQSYIIRRIALDLPFNLVDAIVIGVVWVSSVVKQDFDEFRVHCRQQRRHALRRRTMEMVGEF